MSEKLRLVAVVTEERLPPNSEKGKQNVATCRRGVADMMFVKVPAVVVDPCVELYKLFFLLAGARVQEVGAAVRVQ